MMVAYHIVTIGGLLTAIVFLALAYRSERRVNRWMAENYEDSAVFGYDPDPDDGLSVFDREVRNLHDETLD